MNFSCSELNTTLQFPDYEVSVSEQTLVNSDHHLKKHSATIHLKIRPKELLRERLRLELGFLENKLKLFSIQTRNQLQHKFAGIRWWMHSIRSELAEDEARERRLLATELEKSYLGHSDVDLEVLDKTDSTRKSAKIGIAGADLS